MVACARCGVHMPRSEAKIDAGTFYCRDNPRCTAAG
jgi:late competence protein required for DNA uptake (superfamily II DNA/RNA helicase)